MKKTILNMNIGEIGTIIKIVGGQKIQERVQNMGVGDGFIIKKTSNKVFEINTILRIGIGLGIQNKIIVDVGKI